MARCADSGAAGFLFGACIGVLSEWPHSMTTRVAVQRIPFADFASYTIIQFLLDSS